MTVSILPPAYTTFFDNDGVPVALGSLTTYVVGTTTPKTTWQNLGGTITNTNPIILDAAGRCLCWGTGSYRTILADSFGNEIWDRDTAGFPEVQTYTISPTDYGGDPTGLADSTTALNNASIAAIAQGKPMILNGTYLSNGAVMINAPITILAGAAFIQNSTLALNGAVLAAPSDHIFQGVGAVTFGNAAVPEVYPEWWGAVADGTTNDSAAIQASVTAASGGQVRLGSASYAITTEITLLPNTTIQGSGVGSTAIIPTAPITAFSLISDVPVEAYTALSGFSIIPTVVGVTGVKYTFCSSTMTQDIHFLGCLSTVVVDRGYFNTVQDCTSGATAISVAGTLIIYSSTDVSTHVAGDQYCYFPVVRNYTITPNNEFSITTRTANPCCYFRRVVGGVFDTIKGSLISASSPGHGFIVLENDSQGNKFLNCTAGAVSYMIIIQPGAGIAVAPTYTEITDCDCDFFWSAGIWANGTVASPINFLHITGGFQTAAQTATSPGIYATYTNFVTIMGTQVQNYIGTLGIGIKLENCNLVTAAECQVTQMTVGFVMGAGNTNIFLRDNWFNANTTAITGTVSGGFNRITNNNGINPPAIATPAVPLTTVPYTNTQGYDLRIAVSGTVSAIAVNGIATGLTAGVFLVNTGETITITHAAGAWAWMPL